MAQGSATDDKPQPSRDNQPRLALFWAPVAGIVAALLAIPPFWKDLRDILFDPEQADLPACTAQPFPVKVDAPTQVGNSFDYALSFQCPPAKGEQYEVVFKALNVGDPPHPVYHCKHTYKDVKPGTNDVRKEQFDNASEIGSVREVYVVSMPVNEAHKCSVNVNPRGGGVNHPPSTRVVSNTVTITRGWK